MSNWVMVSRDDSEFLAHSSGPWKKHKYISKDGKNYVYANHTKVGEPKELTDNKPHGRNTGDSDDKTTKSARVKSPKELHNPSPKRTTSREFTLKGDKTVTVHEDSRSGKSSHGQNKAINRAANALAARTKSAKEKLRKAKKK
jgi:hypothetical protein